MVSETRRSPFAALLKIGGSLDDAQDIRLQKSLLVYGSIMFIPVGVIWGIVYIWFHESLAGMIPLSYAIVSFISVMHFALTHRYRFFRASQLALILLLPFLLMISLGGLISASAVIIWSFISPLGALLFAEYKQSHRWLIAYLALLILSGFLQSFLGSTNHLPQSLVIIFFVLAALFRRPKGASLPPAAPGTGSLREPAIECIAARNCGSTKKWRAHYCRPSSLGQHLVRRSGRFHPTDQPAFSHSDG
jgi:hypothetical protein